MRTAAEEVKACGADIIIITEKEELTEGLDENPILIPSNRPMIVLGAVMPIQLIAYERTMLRGITVSNPMHLTASIAMLAMAPASFLPSSNKSGYG
jgi:glucosamine--fructose-6-phosphate aminotransferase (isomerizing)